MNFEENDFIALAKSEIDCAGFNPTFPRYKQAEIKKA